MSTANMPGFTAEASLYKAFQHRLVAANGAVLSTLVVPQIPLGLCTKAAYYCARGYEKWCAIYDINCETDF